MYIMLVNHYDLRDLLMISARVCFPQCTISEFLGVIVQRILTEYFWISRPKIALGGFLRKESRLVSIDHQSTHFSFSELFCDEAPFFDTVADILYFKQSSGEIINTDQEKLNHSDTYATYSCAGHLFHYNGSLDASCNPADNSWCFAGSAPSCLGMIFSYPSVMLKALVVVIWNTQPQRLALNMEAS